MEEVAFDVEGSHFGVADSDALFIGVGIEFAADRQGRLGRGRCNQFDDCDRLVSGRPRQFCVMWQNRRCSILFHLDVPGG